MLATRSCKRSAIPVIASRALLAPTMLLLSSRCALAENCSCVFGTSAIHGGRARSYIAE